MNSKPDAMPEPAAQFEEAASSEDTGETGDYSPEEHVLEQIAAVYAVVISRHFSPRDPKTRDPVMPHIDCGWNKKSGTYEINIWPYPKSACVNGEIDADEYDHHLEEELGLFFEALYERAPKALRVLAPPNAACTSGEFILRTHDPFALLKPLRVLFEELQIPSRDDHLDYMQDHDLCVDATGEGNFTDPAIATPDDTKTSAFATAEDYARYRLERSRLLEQQAGPNIALMLNNQAENDNFMWHLQPRPYLSHADAVYSGVQMQCEKVLPFGFNEVEMLIREELGLPIPQTPEFRRFDIQ